MNATKTTKSNVNVNANPKEKKAMSATELLAEKKKAAAAKKAESKSEAKPAESSVSDSAEEEKAQEKAEKGLEHSAGYQSVVMPMVPTDETSAKALGVKVDELKTNIDANKIDIGLIVVAMRRVRESGESDKKTRAEKNGFGLAGFKSEGEWAFEHGLITFRGKNPETGERLYNRHFLLDCVNAALIHLALLNEGVERGAHALSGEDVNSIVRLGQKGATALVSKVAGALIAGAESEKIGKMIAKAAADRAEAARQAAEERRNVRLRDVPDEKLYKGALDSVIARRDYLAKYVKDRLASAMHYVSEVEKRYNADNKFCTAQQMKDLKSQVSKLQDDLLALCKIARVDVG